MSRVILDIFDQADIRVNGDRPWDITVHNERLWRRLFLYGSVGLGDAYMDGWWDCPAVDEFIHRILEVVSWGRRHPWRVSLAGFLAGTLVNLQSLGRAFQVGERHYDIGNDLYRLMLGEDMVYSCGYWQAGAKSLEQAQRDKLELVCRKLGLEPGMRVLDIGCGWGSFCKYAAERYGVEAVGITISKEQVRYAEEHLVGLPVEIRLQDYRTYDGIFDAVVSIGMFEHVGPKNYGRYMDVARHSLKDEGIFLLHTIGANVTHSPVRSWITKHIFPSGYIPSIRQVGTSVENRFVVEDLHNFGPDYALTLMAWHENFEREWSRIKGSQPMYTDRFYRMWRYYLLSCAGAFRARDLQVWQWVLSTGDTSSTYNRPALNSRDAPVAF
jgi:cyclopropane-fatty-acyl-phospholipid synthase